MTRGRQRAAAALLIAAYVVAACAWSVATPIFEAPDEPGHVDYVAHLVLRGALPVQSVARRNYAHHPPLYYVAAALAAGGANWDDQRAMPIYLGSGGGPAAARHSEAERWPWRGRVAAVHVARLVSIAFGAAAVAFVIAAGWTAFPERPAVGWLAGALLAWTPQWTFITGTVNNDAAAAATGAAVLWTILRARERPGERRRWVLLGLACGAALLSKSSTLAVVAAASAAWALNGRRRTDRRAWLVDGAALHGTIALTAGWWFLRNAMLYGDPIGWAVYREAWSSMLRTAAPDLGEAAQIADLAWRSYWGWFGWLTLDAGDWLHAAANVLVWGAAFSAWRGGIFLAQYTRRSEVLVCAAIAALHALYLIALNAVQGPVMAQGRHFFPAAGAAMTAMAAGLLSSAERPAWPAAAAVAAAAATANAACLFLIVLPAYA